MMKIFSMLMLLYSCGLAAWDFASAEPVWGGIMVGCAAVWTIIFVTEVLDL